MFRDLDEILDLAHDAILIRDPSGKILYWNRGAEKYFGWLRSEAIGQSSFNILKTHYPQSSSELESALAVEGHWEGELTHQTKLGAPVSMLSRWALKRDADGNPQSILEIHHDITARKKAEAELAEANRRLEALLCQRTQQLQSAETRFFTVIEETPAIVFIKDREGRYLFVNRQFERTFGFRREEILGKSSWEVYGVHVAQHLQDHDREVFAGKSIQKEETLPQSDGDHTYISVKFPLYEGEEIIGVCGIATDITGRKADEQALRNKADDLTRSNQDLERFAYVSSHDLKEPLRMVIAYSQLLQREAAGYLSRDGASYLTHVTSSAQRMYQLIEDLLNFARAGREDREDYRWLQSGDLVEEVLGNLVTSIQESKAVLRIGKLPEIWANPMQLKQLMQNLLSNAMKFRSDRPVIIDVNATEEEDAWRFTVKDNGIGMEPDYHDRIFRMFQRLHTRTEYRGNGVGLAICKRIIDQHKGKIWVDSVLNEGSSFHFTVPKALRVTASPDRRDDWTPPPLAT